MAKFIAHCFVHKGLESIRFAPGDDVPDWVIGKVGSHVIDDADTPAQSDTSDDEDTSESTAQDEASEETPDAVEDESPGKEDEPDFTKPAARKSRATTKKS